MSAIAYPSFTKDDASLMEEIIKRASKGPIVLQVVQSNGETLLLMNELEQVGEEYVEK